LSYNSTSITTTLISPTNESIISDVGTNFTAIFNITRTNANNYTWKNATYYVWKNGDLFNTTTISLSGNNTNYTQNIDNLLWQIINGMFLLTMEI